MLLLWLVGLNLHLIVLVRHAPEIARWRLHRLPILHYYLEVLHLELPSEEHALVAFAFGFELVAE